MRADLQAYERQLAEREIRYRAKHWLCHRAFWLFWLLPASNAITAFVIYALPREQWLSALLCLQLAAIALGLVVRVMIENPPGGRSGS